MNTLPKIVVGLVIVAGMIGLVAAANPGAMTKQKYLVVASEGPGFASPEETMQVLEKGILPTFDALHKLEADKKIIAGGLPVGERKFVFVLEASSNEEVDQILRDIPSWGVLKWQVTPLQSFDGRAQMETNILAELKKRMK